MPIENGNHDQRSRKLLGIGFHEDAAGDFHAVELIAVNSGRDEHGRPRPGPVQHVHGQGYRCVIGQLGYGQIDELALARPDGQSSDDERLSHDEIPACAPVSGPHEVHEWSSARKRTRPVSLPILRRQMRRRGPQRRAPLLQRPSR